MELKRSEPDARWLAGGMTLLPSMKLRLAAPSCLIDLADLGELKGISVEQDLVTLGGMTRHRGGAFLDVGCYVVSAIAALYPEAEPEILFSEIITKIGDPVDSFGRIARQGNLRRVHLQHTR